VQAEKNDLGATKNPSTDLAIDKPLKNDFAID